jgi:uncharacterized repeat protein (TIGR03803 family)
MGDGLGYGTIFRIAADGTFTNIFLFSGANGAYPFTGLIKGKGGVFYGTTHNQGANGFGTVFCINTNGALTTLAAFSNTNGAHPKGVLLQANDGTLYGTTYFGGSADLGTVFHINTNGDLTTLVSFASTNGAYPIGGLVQGHDGLFYGATSRGGIFDGGAGFGTIFSLTANGQLNTVYQFMGYGDAYPYGDLVQLEDGFLYGATQTSLFRISTNGYFTRIGFNPLDPIYPRSGLTRGPDSALYGMLSDRAFRITTNGVVYPLYPFYNYWNGSDPRASLVGQQYTTFYGTTAQGGQLGGGVVFRIDLNFFFFSTANTTQGCNLFFSALPGNSYRILRAADATGPWTTVTNVLPDEYGMGKWTDTSAQERALYRLAYP